MFSGTFSSHVTLLQTVSPYIAPYFANMSRDPRTMFSGVRKLKASEVEITFEVSKPSTIFVFVDIFYLLLLKES